MRWTHRGRQQTMQAARIFDSVKQWKTIETEAEGCHKPFEAGN